MRGWRPLLVAVVATAAVALGVAIAMPAHADPIEDGGTAQIATQSVDGVRYCVIATSELQPCVSSSTAHRYTFVSRTCGGTGNRCYQIRTAWGGCLYHNAELDKIGHGTCNPRNVRQRWRIDEPEKSGMVRLRPATDTSRCVVYDPAKLPDYPYTFIKKCAAAPASHTWLWLVRV